MSFTRTQLIANTREMMDATNSARWTDAFVSTVLGIVSGREWSGILSANPYFRFAQRSVTTDASGLAAYTALDSGTGDTAETHYRILSITDGQNIYRETSFMDAPLGTVGNSGYTYRPSWYDAGSNFQILPVSASLALTVSVNWTPPRIDQLSADSVTVDFPDGHEIILCLEAAAMLLSKGAAENDAAQTMRAMADQERTQMYSDLARRAAKPQFLGFSDNSTDWGGR